jgi:alpha-tubulin suppressor-like RCC1 family protein
MLSTTLALLALGVTATGLPGQSDTLHFTYVAAGGRNTCAIAPRGVAYCWGANDQGQLGNGDRLTESKRQPTRVATEHRFLSLAVGGRFACGLTVDSLALCWGANRDGQLGNGTTDQSLVPVPVADSIHFAGLAAGRAHACGLTADGRAYCWGSNTDAQIGDSGSWKRGSFHTKPVAVVGGHEFSALVGGGWDSSCGLATSGEALCWGGVDLLKWRATPTSIPIVVSDTIQFWALTGGADHLCGLSDEATLCWGENRSGQLGDGTNDRQIEPTPVASDSMFIRLTAGSQHTCGLTVPGQVFCWGANQSGQLGTGRDAYSNRGWNTPQPVFGDLAFRVIVAGESHTCGMVADGQLYCWGENRAGQLGSGSVGMGWRNSPTLVGGS